MQTHIDRQARDTYIDGLRDPSRAQGKGGGSFANHAQPPNAEKFEEANSLYLKAKESILPGDEITLSYGKPGQLAYEVAMGNAKFKK